MTKIAILGDLHWGMRNRNLTIERWQRKFFEECFWPYIDEHNITKVLQLGDYFDSRKWLNIQTIALQKEVFVKQIQDRDIECHVLVGNHDIPLRYSLENNSPEQILSLEDNITTWSEPGVWKVDDVDITLMPWICKDNQEECIEILDRGGDILAGHFEINGFSMSGVSGITHKGGQSLSIFKKFKTVWSGHFHSQSHHGNIRYLGTPYQMSWSEAGGKHGFWVFDTVDRSMTFIRNPFDYFNRIDYDDDKKMEHNNLRDSYVKVYVKSKTDFEKFDNFIESINFQSPYEVRIIESFEDYSEENVKEIIELTDTVDIISDYVDGVATTNNKEAIKKIMIEIYEEAMRVDVD